MSFSDWLTRKRLELSARKGRRVTQTEIATAAEISRQYYGFLEAGTYPVEGKVLERDLVARLAHALQTDEQDAFFAAGFGEQLTDEERDVLRRLRTMEPEPRQAFQRMLETIVPNWTSTLPPRPSGVGGMAPL